MVQLSQGDWGKLAIVMVYSVAGKKFKVQVDEDLLHDVLVGVFTKLRNFDPRRAGVSTFLHYIVVSELINQLNRRNEISKKACFLEDVSFVWSEPGDRFYDRFLRVISRYLGVVGRDLLRILLGDMSDKEYQNILRSASVSKVKGADLLERWLGRPLSEFEKQLVVELQSIL